MKKFLFLSYGFEKPTPEIMEKWMAWFKKVGPNMVEQGHLPQGAEVSSEGTKPLPFGPDSMTGYMIFNAESMDAAQSLVEECPYVDANRVYEIRAQ